MTAEEDAEAAYAALTDALEDVTAPCEGIELFTTEGRLAPVDEAFCRALCDSCLVQRECDAYAVAADVRVGFWAGIKWTQKGRQPRKDAPASPAPTPPTPNEQAVLSGDACTDERNDMSTTPEHRPSADGSRLPDDEYAHLIDPQPPIEPRQPAEYVRVIGDN